MVFKGHIGFWVWLRIPHNHFSSCRHHQRLKGWVLWRDNIGSVGLYKIFIFFQNLYTELLENCFGRNYLNIKKILFRIRSNDPLKLLVHSLKSIYIQHKHTHTHTHINRTETKVNSRFHFFKLVQREVSRWAYCLGVFSYI